MQVFGQNYLSWNLHPVYSTQRRMWDLQAKLWFEKCDVIMGLWQGKAISTNNLGVSHGLMFQFILSTSYHIFKDQSSLPAKALTMICYHSFYPWHREGAYVHLTNKQDAKSLAAVQAFNPYDLHIQKNWWAMWCWKTPTILSKSDPEILPSTSWLVIFLYIIPFLRHDWWFFCILLFLFLDIIDMHICFCLTISLSMASNFCEDCIWLSLINKWVCWSGFEENKASSTFW